MSEEMAGRLTGMGLGIFIGLVLVLVILKLTKKDGRIKCKYDERQEIIRGKGFKYAFAALAVYDFVYGMVNSMGERAYVDPLAGMVFGIMIGITVYACYCIWNDSYFSLNESPKKVMIAFGLIGLFNIFIGICNIINGEILEDGMISFRCTNLICGVVMFVIMGVIAARKAAVRREDEEA